MLTDADRAALRVQAEALAPAGCATSRRVLLLLAEWADAERFLGVLLTAHDSMARQCERKDALCLAAADKLLICADTIAALAERCHGQSALLGRKAEKGGMT